MKRKRDYQNIIEILELNVKNDFNSASVLKKKTLYYMSTK